MRTMEIFLVRHGQTAGNLAGRYIGRTDEPLCEEGVAYARQTGVFPGIGCVYVSPMRRAGETAAILFPNARYIVCSDLREMDFGDFEGRSADEMADDSAYRTWVDGGCLDACPNGESAAEFSARICSAFDKIVQDAVSDGKNKECQKDGRLIIVAHGGTIMALMFKYARPLRNYFDWHVKNIQGWHSYLDENMWDKEPALTSYDKLEVLDL